MSLSRPLPNLVDEPYAQPFWEGTRNERLLLQFCTDCDRYQFFPRPLCQSCGGENLEWKEASGSGRVHAYTLVRRTIKNPGFEPDLPYLLGLIDLEEGPRIYSRIVNCDAEEIAVGDPVEVTFERRSAEVTLPVFRPVEGS